MIPMIQQPLKITRMVRLEKNKYKQGKSEGFDSCDRPSNLAQTWSKSSIF